MDDSELSQDLEDFDVYLAQWRRHVAAWKVEKAAILEDGTTFARWHAFMSSFRELMLLKDELFANLDDILARQNARKASDDEDLHLDLGLD